MTAMLLQRILRLILVAKADTMYGLLLCVLMHTPSVMTAGGLDSSVCTGKFSRDSLKEGVWVCRIGKRVLSKERYSKGRLQTYIRFNEKGQIIETRNRRGKVKTFNPCGC